MRAGLSRGAVEEPNSERDLQPILAVDEHSRTRHGSVLDLVQNPLGTAMASLDRETSTAGRGAERGCRAARRREGELVGVAYPTEASTAPSTSQMCEYLPVGDGQGEGD